VVVRLAFGGAVVDVVVVDVVLGDVVVVLVVLVVLVVVRGPPNGNSGVPERLDHVPVASVVVVVVAGGSALIVFPGASVVGTGFVLADRPVRILLFAGTARRNSAIVRP